MISANSGKPTAKFAAKLISLVGKYYPQYAFRELFSARKLVTALLKFLYGIWHDLAESRRTRFRHILRQAFHHSHHVTEQHPPQLALKLGCGPPILPTPENGGQMVAEIELAKVGGPIISLNYRTQTVRN
jgi:hypothetical protein